MQGKRKTSKTRSEVAVAAADGSRASFATRTHAWLAITLQQFLLSDPESLQLLSCRTSEAEGAGSERGLETRKESHAAESWENRNTGSAITDKRRDEDGRTADPSSCVSCCPQRSWFPALNCFSGSSTSHCFSLALLVHSSKDESREGKMS